MMSVFARALPIALISSVLLSQSAPILAQSTSGTASNQTTATLRDAAHDFDFDFGAWKTHSSRLMHPLSGSNDWADMDGITVVKKVWNGRANIAEYKADGAAGHVELLSLRWYNPAAHQWNLDFATPNVGVLGVPGTGEFRNGRGDFYDQEEINGRFVLVRFSIWPTGADKARSEQAFSADGGETWEVNWVNTYERVSADTEIDWGREAATSDPHQHDFDFNPGVWHTEITRTADPFTAPDHTMALRGTVTVRRIWGGRAQLEEIEADGSTGHWEGLTLFLYNPKSHQWSQSFINSSMGVLDLPLVGDFKQGRGELFSGDTFKGRSILVRGVWSDIEQSGHRYDESYSDDGGTTWKQAFGARVTIAKR